MKYQSPNAIIFMESMRVNYMIICVKIYGDFFGRNLEHPLGH